MNAKLFRDWEDAAQVDPRVARQFYMLLESVDGKKADELLEKAIQAKMSPMRFALTLKMERLDTTGVTEVIQKVRAEKMADPRPGPNFVIMREERSDEKSRPVDPIRPMGGSRPKEASPKSSGRFEGIKNFFSKFTQKKGDGNKVWPIVIGVVLVVALLSSMGALLYFTDPGGSLELANPGEGSGQPVEVPVVTPQKDPWFVKVFDKSLDAKEPFLKKPASISDFTDNFPWRWVLWVGFLFPLWMLLRQDRFAAKERTDVQAAANGLLVLFLGIFLAGPLTALTQYLFFLAGYKDTVIPEFTFILLGVVANLVVQWNASMSGRRDMSAFNIAGLFATGVILIWWFVPDPIAVIVGTLMMMGGVYSQAREMSRTHQGGRAIMTALIMLAIFGVVMSAWCAVAGLAANVPAPTDEVQTKAIVLYLLFQSRFFVGALLGMALASWLGGGIAALLMPPANADHVVFKGRQQPNHLNGESGSPDDFDSTWHVEARFDAMAFGIMSLYLLSPVVYYVFVFFLLV